MSTMNIFYPAKAVITSLIQSVFTRTYNQLPLSNVSYPFAVYELTFLENAPGAKMQVLIDCWDNSLGLIAFNQLVDQLVDKLDRINESNGDCHFSGEVPTIRDVPTQEESLNRIQVIAVYDIYKVTA